MGRARLITEEEVRSKRARDPAVLERAGAEIHAKTNVETFTVAADLSQLEGVSRVVESARGRFGRIDILVNNARAIRGGDFFAIPDQQWITDWNLKLLGYVRMARAVFPLMRARGGGRIVNVIGAAARNPTATYLPGGAANAALINFTKGLADLGAPANILVTAVSPAATRADRWEALLAQQATAAGRTLDVSARASFLTGICITVDGGATRGVYL